MTNSFDEIKDNDVLLVIGSNTTETHPIIGLEMKKAVRRGAKLIVIDPRKIELVRWSHDHLQLKPGTDVALLNCMMNVIIQENLAETTYIDERTQGYPALARSLEGYTPEYGEEVTGVPREKIISTARLYAGTSRAGIYYTMGVTQHTHGTDNVFAIANLALMTGNLGRRSTGINPLRGQNNVQGATDMGCIPAFYPGYQSVGSAEVKSRFERAWRTSLSSSPGMTATEMIDAAVQGSLKALYIKGENPVLSDPDMQHTLKAFRNLDFLVVQDIFLTETAQVADVILPAACFAEKEGTFTNSERRVQRVRKAVDPPGEAREDSWIISQLSSRMGYDISYDRVEDVFREAAGLWPALGGMHYHRLDQKGLQWPCPTSDHPGTPYLFKGAFPKRVPAFTEVHYRPSEELPDREYPLVLNTGRELFHYHTGTMTRRNQALNLVSSGGYVEIHPADARESGIEDGRMVRVTSRRGSIDVPARISRRPLQGTVFIPFHFAEASANMLTNTAVDPIARIPELKVCAVKLEPMDNIGKYIKEQP